jgi:hypothetical protein
MLTRRRAGGGHRAQLQAACRGAPDSGASQAVLVPEATQRVCAPK